MIKETAKNAGKGAASGAVIGGASYYAVTPTEDRSLEKGIKYATGGAVTGALANVPKNPFISGIASGAGTGLTQVYAGDEVDIPSAIVNGATGAALKPLNLGIGGDLLQGVATTAAGERSKINISFDVANDNNGITNKPSDSTNIKPQENSNAYLSKERQTTLSPIIRTPSVPVVERIAIPAVEKPSVPVIERSYRNE